MKYKNGIAVLFGCALAFNCVAQDSSSSTNLASASAITFTGKASPPDAPLTLWYRQPAKKWVDASPLGNGRIGAMVFGGVPREHIQLNEDTIWNGQKRDRDNPEAAKYLPEVRQLLFDGKPIEATKLEDHLMGVPNRQPPYQPLGDLFLDFPDQSEVADYQRELNLPTGISKVTYRIGDAHYTREVFISAPDQAVVVRITCDQPNHVSLRATLTREQDSETKISGEDKLVMIGEARAHKSGWIEKNAPPERNASDRAQIETNGVKFQATLRAIPEGGTVIAADGALNISNANAVTLLLVAATDYQGGNPAKECKRYLARATKPFEELRAAQITDHEKIFNRVELQLGDATTEQAAEAIPTDERMENFRHGANDPGLSALYFQFGRYLLMDSSRPGSLLPANLQGIWNDKMMPPWDSKYTININTEMNYWPAEVANLPEMTGPLFNLIHLSIPNGRKTAREMYGAGGFCFHHNLDAWGDTAPVDYAYCGMWPMGGAWLSLHFWEHYRYNLDEKFLRKEAYPVMKEAAEFLHDYLIEDGKGHLVTNPSMSPENNYRMTNGVVAFQTVGATMDYEIIYQLFTACIQASEILNTDKNFRDQLAATLKRIPELQIGKHGQLREWSEDYDEPSPGIGHVSHLFAVYPGDEITLRGTPELAQAARVSLQRRADHGGGDGGFPAAWFAALWARFGSGDNAYHHIHNEISRSVESLFNASGVFQIDGNFGATAAIAEMLLQSHNGEISILPALPKVWADGSFKGLRARGAVEVDATWSNSRVTLVKLRPSVGGEQHLRFPDGQQIAKIQCDGHDVDFKTESNGAYVVQLEPHQEYAIAFQ
jgi:alpha-L-fucosidase 2